MQSSSLEGAVVGRMRGARGRGDEGGWPLGGGVGGVVSLGAMGPPQVTGAAGEGGNGAIAEPGAREVGGGEGDALKTGSGIDSLLDTLEEEGVPALGRLQAVSELAALVGRPPKRGALEMLCDAGGLEALTSALRR